jgi:SAM-dependent methyltransferase
VTREHAIYHEHSLRPFLDRVAAESGGGLAVDLGCGTGVVTEALARRGFRVIGVDHSPEMLALARERMDAAGVGDAVELRHQDLLRARLPEATADVVTCQGVLHHLSDLDPCVKAIAHTLRPGGSFYISEPCEEATPVGKLIGAGVRTLVAARRRVRPRDGASRPESIEAPIRSRELLDALRAQGLSYRAEFATHIPLAHRFVSDDLRRRVTLLISAPWRHRRGDIVFVEGTRPD